MNLRFGPCAGAVAIVAVLGLAAVPDAHAACKTLSFSVNDYGKEGPTRDALALLDKHIANWTRSKGIKGYTVGKKDVSCELYLNLIVVDEHTCKASARVCWGDAAAKTSASPPAAK